MRWHKGFASFSRIPKSWSCRILTNCFCCMFLREKVWIRIRVFGHTVVTVECLRSIFELLLLMKKEAEYENFEFFPFDWRQRIAFQTHLLYLHYCLKMRQTEIRGFEKRIVSAMSPPFQLDQNKRSILLTSFETGFFQKEKNNFRCFDPVETHRWLRSTNRRIESNKLSAAHLLFVAIILI